MVSKKEKTPIGSIMIRIACTLFCLVLISTSMMSGLYARYTARGNSTDSARVAKFVVGADLDPENVSVDLGQGQTEGSFVLTTENTSEVAVRYDVIFTATLPSGVSLLFDGHSVTLSDGKYISIDNGFLRYSDSWVFGNIESGNEHVCI